MKYSAFGTCSIADEKGIAETERQQAAPDDCRPQRRAAHAGEAA